MEKNENFLDFFQRTLLFWLAGSVVAGLSFVKFYGGMNFSPAVCLIAALLMIYPSLVSLAFDRLGEFFRDGKKISAISLVINFLFLPGIAFFSGWFFLEDFPDLWLGLMLLAILPGGGMATTWALKSRADMPTVVGLLFLNLAVAVLVTPFLLAFFYEKFIVDFLANFQGNASACVLSEISKGGLSCGFGSGSIGPVEILLPMIVIIIIPAFLAFLTQKAIKKFKGEKYFEEKKNFFVKLSNVGLVLVVFLLMSIKENVVLFERTDMVLRSIPPLVVFYFFSIAGSLYLWRKFFSDAKGKALVWSIALRYITLALGLSLAMIFQNPQLISVTVVILLSYFVQIPLSFWIVEYLNRKTG